MNSFLAALQFLTIVPIRIRKFSGAEYAQATAYFPAAGALIGISLVLAREVFFWTGFPAVSSGALLVVLLALLTGALHLDGVADTFDALASRKDRRAMLEVMRDPHLGSAGVVAVVCVLMAKAALLFPLGGEAGARSIVLACVVSRWAMVILMAWFPCARPGGEAARFIEGIDARCVFLSTLGAVVFAFVLLGMTGFLCMVTAAGFAALAGAHALRRFGGITGDTLGAAAELTELLVLFIAPLVTVKAAFA